MNPTTYAKALHSATLGLNREDTDERIKSFIEVIKSRGHEKLLPSILSSYEKKANQKDEYVTLTVATERNLKEIKEEIENYSEEFSLQDLKTEIDKSIIGGYVLRSQNNLYDKSFRKALIKLYQKIIA